jgi:hypothetical protein
VAQFVKHLYSKHEALSSNPSTAKKKKESRKPKERIKRKKTVEQRMKGRAGFFRIFSITRSTMRR